MTRKDIEKHMLKAFGCAPDYPWFRFPNYAVYRHKDSRKWFAVVMDVSKRKFGFDAEETVEVMNVKCEEILVDSLLSQNGVFPAYHMSKGTWVSVWLDGSVPPKNLKWLIDMSFDLTKNK